MLSRTPLKKLIIEIKSRTFNFLKVDILCFSIQNCFFFCLTCVLRAQVSMSFKLRVMLTSVLKTFVKNLKNEIIVEFYVKKSCFLIFQ